MRKTKWGLCLVLLVLVLGLVTVLAACGDEEETTTTAPAATETTAPAATETTAPAATETTAPAATETTAPAAAETLKIGAILALTDWYSVVDAADERDLKLTAQMINEDGGIQVQGTSYNIELAIEDCKSSLDGASAAATKLVLDDKLQFVVGPGAFFNLATAQIFEQNKVLHVANYNGCNPDEMNSTTTYAFLGLDPITQANAELKALLKYYPDVKTVCLATEDATYEAFKPHFLALVERLGLTLSGDPVLFATNAEDYNPVAAQIKAQNPDSVWMPVGIDPSYFGILTGLRTLGWDGPVTFPIDAPSVTAALGDAATGIVGVLSKQVTDPYMAEPMKRLLEMGDVNRHIFGLAPNALYLLAHAIESADSLDPTEVRDHWETLTSLPTLYGDGFPSGNQLFGLTNHAWANPIPVALVNDGQVEYKEWIIPDVTP